VGLGPYGRPVSDASEQSCEMFVQIWAEEVERLIKSVRQLRDKSERDLRAAEYGEDWSPRDEDLYRNFRALWPAQHQLVWAAYQLERWRRRLAVERKEQPPALDPVLANLRNALEHLDEAELNNESYADAGPSGRSNRSLRALPDSRLLIGTHGRLLFGLVDPDDVERRAASIVNGIETAEMERAEDRRRTGLPSMAFLIMTTRIPIKIRSESRQQFGRQVGHWVRGCRGDLSTPTSAAGMRRTCCPLLPAP
jgi:hypothetical protein